MGKQGPEWGAFLGEGENWNSPAPCPRKYLSWHTAGSPAGCRLVSEKSHHLPTTPIAPAVRLYPLSALDQSGAGIGVCVERNDQTGVEGMYRANSVGEEWGIMHAREQ